MQTFKQMYEAKFNERENEKLLDKHWDRVWNTISAQAGDWTVHGKDQWGYSLWTMDVTIEVPDEDYKEYTIKVIGTSHPDEGVSSLEPFKKRNFREYKQAYKRKR